RDEDIVTVNAQTGFALWPNFCSEDWEENYAAYVGDPNHGALDLSVTPISADGIPERAEASIDSHQRELRIWRCLNVPMGFSLRYQDVQANRPEYAGVVLRDRLNTPPKI